VVAIVLAVILGHVYGAGGIAASIALGRLEQRDQPDPGMA